MKMHWLSNRSPARAHVALLALLLLLACATSPTGRRQLLLMPESQMAEMGRSAFTEMKSEMPTVADGSDQAVYVRCVADAIVETLRPEQVRGLAIQEWEVEVFQDDSANAFALPGGKIGVHTGLLRVAENQDQLATVVGHEIGHVLAQHGNARVSNSQLAQSGLAIASVFMGGDPQTQQQLMGLLGLGVQVGVLMPFSRAHESEADEIGLELMARAGFDPREAVSLWQNMGQAAGGQAPPEFLSTHPSHGTRITQLQQKMNEVLPIYQRAREEGRTPECRR
ncbi:MAG: M48 family metallopeptidase [bacterium]